MVELLVLGFAVSERRQLNIFAVIVLYRYRERKKYEIQWIGDEYFILSFMFGPWEEKELVSRKQVNNLSRQVTVQSNSF